MRPTLGAWESIRLTPQALGGCVARPAVPCGSSGGEPLGRAWGPRPTSFAGLCEASILFIEILKFVSVSSVLL